MPAATVNTTSGLLCEIPANSYGVVIQNEGSTPIRININREAALTGLNKGILIPAATDDIPTEWRLEFESGSSAEVININAIATASTSDITYIFMQYLLH